MLFERFLLGGNFDHIWSHIIFVILHLALIAFLSTESYADTLYCMWATAVLLKIKAGINGSMKNI